MADKFSHFHAKSRHSHYTIRGAGLNATGDFTEILLGDDVPATPGVEPDDRHSMIFTWDLSDPDTVPFNDPPVPKGAILSNSSLTLSPTRVTLEPFNDNSTFEFGLLAPDGHWNRPTTHPLHTNQSGITYSAPSHSATIRMRASNAASPLYSDTMSDQTGSTVLTTNTGALPYLHTFGCTMRIPAHQSIDSITVNLCRPVAGGLSAVDMRLNVYSLFESGRHYALEKLEGSSDLFPYLSLVQSADPAANTVTFTFSTPIPAQAYERWVGVMIEGPWFSETYRTTHLITVQYRVGTSQSAYLAGTDGSLMYATTKASHQVSNALWPYYYLHNDVPALYPQASAVRLDTPYRRYFDTPLVNTNSGPWSIQLSYGHSGHTHNVTGWLALMQAWLNSDYFDPENGKSWIGMILEVQNPSNLLWGCTGIDSGTEPILGMTWDYPYHDTVKSFGLSSFGAVESDGVEVSAAVESHGVEALASVESDGLEVSPSVENHGVSVTPSVDASIKVEDC